MLLLANLFWGLSFPLVKSIALVHAQLVPASSTWFIAAYTIAPRFLLATLVLIVVLGRRIRTITRREIEQGSWLGLMAGGGMLLQNDGLQFTSVSVSSFLTQLYAIMIPFYFALQVRRWPSPLILGCAALVFVGVAVLGRFDFLALQIGRGEFETLLCSGFFMAQILLLEGKRYTANRALPITLVMFVVEALVFSIVSGATAPQLSDLLIPWTNGPWLLFTGLLTVFCTLGSFILMNQWQPKITATEAGLIYCLEPIFASIMALFLPAIFAAWAGFTYANEQLTWHLLLGGGLITLANVLLQLNPPAKT